MEVREGKGEAQVEFEGRLKGIEREAGGIREDEIKRERNENKKPKKNEE